jgi:hypothetical protein
MNSDSDQVGTSKSKFLSPSPLLVRIIRANDLFGTSTVRDHPLQLLSHWKCPLKFSTYCEALVYAVMFSILTFTQIVLRAIHANFNCSGSSLVVVSPLEVLLNSDLL